MRAFFAPVRRSCTITHTDERIGKSAVITRLALLIDRASIVRECAPICTGIKLRLPPQLPPAQKYDCLAILASVLFTSTKRAARMLQHSNGANHSRLIGGTMAKPILPSSTGERPISSVALYVRVSGRLMFQIIGAMAEFERALIQERVKAGLSAARHKGIKLGRPRSGVDPFKVAALRSEGVAWRDIAKRLGCGVGTAVRSAQQIAA